MTVSLQPLDIGLVPGNCVVIRIPGGFTYTGRVVAVYPTHLAIIEAAWISESGRWAEFLANGEADGMEVEPYPDDVVVRVPRQLSEISDWMHPLLRKTV